MKHIQILEKYDIEVDYSTCQWIALVKLFCTLDAELNIYMSNTQHANDI